MKVEAVVHIEKEYPVNVNFDNFGKLVSVLLANVYILAAVLLFFLLIFGGIRVIIGAGENNPGKTEEGKKAVTAAIIGFLLIFFSYWIIQLIEVATGLKILKSEI